MDTHRRQPDGFTLLEILVALTILGAGMLGLVGSAALVWRLIGNGSRMTVAATVAAARFEHLRSLSCARIAAGTATTRGIEERWTVAPLGVAESSRALEVQLSVSYRVRVSHGTGTERIQRFTGALPCPYA